MFEFLDHTADTAVRLTADDEEDLVQSAVDALRCIYLGAEAGEEFERRARAGEGTSLPISLTAEDGEALLIDLLGELIFLFDTRRFLCGRVEPESLSLGRPARVRGKLVGVETTKLQLETEIKAATYHDVRIRRDGGKLTVDVVFDL